MPIERFHRDYSMRYEDILVKPKPIGWVEIWKGDGAERRYQFAGWVEATLCTRTEKARHEFMVVQVEKRSTWGAGKSHYESNILIGNLVDGPHMHDIFHTGNRISRQGLHCVGCFAGAGVGLGMEVPSWLIGRYFGGFSQMPPCTTCGAKPIVYLPSEYKEEGEAHVFSAIQNHELQEAVEAALAPLGVGSRLQTCVERDDLPEGFCEEVVAEAMHPRRVQWLLEKHGFDALEIF